MKTLHLICNAHLDPVWQWDWDEGIAAALSTFYSAVKLAEEYDFIFCHNEVLLYKYIEKYDSKLFSKIQELVKQGKWKIMGGWYVQPDCMVPSGESFIRQISLGREYFKDKFDAYVTTAINFDAFAHTRGLVSILKHCGYDSYLFCRPMPDHDLFSKDKLPNGPFLWKGYDGSVIKALRQEDISIYCSALGKAKEAILRKASHYPNEEHVCILWGIGNHGGGPSRKDLNDIIDLQNEKKDEFNIIHSTPETYFKNVNPSKVVNRQLITFFKSYSSCHNIKFAHDQLENALYLSEKVCTIADIEGLYHYNKDAFKRAEETLCQIEFHDVLSGTSIKRGIDSSVRKAHMAIEELKEEFFIAFNKLAERLPKVKDGDDNFVLLNPYPYPYEGLVECELFALDGIDPRYKQYQLTLYDKDNNTIPHQIIKEDSEIDVDRRKRVIFKVNIPATSVISIGVHKEEIPKVNKADIALEKEIVLKDNVKTIKISKETGLVTSFTLGDKEYLNGDSFVPTIFNDNDDPWGWHLTRFNEKYDIMHQPYNRSNAFKTIRLNKSNKGIFANLENVSVTEDGELLTTVQALFTYQESHIVVQYKVYKNLPYIDVNYHVVWNEKNRGLKIMFSLNGEKKYFAQSAFGVEKYKADSNEYPINRYVGVTTEDKAFVIYNNSGVHSASKTGKKLYLTLLNGSSYCAHPTDHLPILPNHKRFPPYIEIGTHDFSLRVGINRMSECEKLAKEFNERIYSLLYFPHGEDNVSKDTVLLSNPNIVITALKRRNDGTYLIRLYNGSEETSSAKLVIKDVSIDVSLKKYEFKTYIFNQKEIKLVSEASIY